MRSQSGRKGVCARDARSGRADRRSTFAPGASRAHRAGEMGRNETKRKRNGELRFCADPPLKRSRSEASGLAILSVFCRLVVLLFRLGENGARRAGDQSDTRCMSGECEHGGFSNGRRIFYRDSDIPKDIVRACESRADLPLRRSRTTERTIRLGRSRQKRRNEGREIGSPHATAAGAIDSSSP
jgi:hypothetical protein